MKKKVVAALLCAAMTMTLFAGCGSKDGDTQQSESKNNSEQSSQPSGGEDSQAPSTPSGPADAEAIDVDPAYHFALDGTDAGLMLVERTDKKAEQTGANFGIDENSGLKQLIADGPVGQCTYFDGKYAIKLPMESPDSNEFTISLWINGDRMGDYGATLQMGHNMYMAEADATVSWINFTQGPWSSSGGPLFPVVWNRNSSNDTWPWTGYYDDSVHGKKEWVHVALVATGEKYDYTDPASGAVSGRIRSKFYVNGVCVNDSQGNSIFTGEPMDGYSGLAPDIFTASYGGFEAYLGINYWDVVFKGFMDEVYVYNKALTDGQVATLFAEGNPNVTSTPPASADVADDPAPKTVEVVINGTQVGATDCSSPWWTDFSETWAVANGETVTKTFTNYHKTEDPANWNNFSVVLANVPNAHSTDADANYKEYAVCRADNWGWRGEDTTGEKLDVLGWTVESNWDWSTFADDMQGATVVLSVTNNGSTADIVADVTTTEGKTYQQKYLNIAIDGDLYFSLVVDAACLDIQN